MGHFARECRSPKNQESRPKNQDNSRKTVNVEDTSSKAMVGIDEVGFDWSYMANDEAPTNMALIAFSVSKVQNSKTCSNTYLKSFETLKTQYNNLRIEFNKSEFDLATCKRDLDTMSIDDLYNNFKNVEQDVKKTVTTSSSSRSQNMAFLSSLGSTNEVDTANIQVSTGSTPVSTVSTHDNTTNLSDVIVYAFLANQPNGYQLVHEDL
uniref:Uncharacterized protein n=1 Tax=Tanacetum cinerariifolium TaxID=118510 RepID=A0A699JQV6_TANCI|nr:hypothetical protein [Tanacetum cinerariifolium]